MVHANGARVREAVDRVVVSVRENGSTLDGTRASILTLEHVSNRMFNAVLSAGVSHRDSAIVELAAKVRGEFVGIAGAALERGEQIGRAAGRERGGPYVGIRVYDGFLNQNKAR